MVERNEISDSASSSGTNNLTLATISSTEENLDLFELFTDTKIKEFTFALKNRHSTIIIVYGPTGSLKTSLIHKLVDLLGLKIEYVPNIMNYKSKLLDKKAICLTDIDDQAYINKHKSKIEKMTNLIIETRCLLYMNKSFTHSVLINTKISLSQLKRYYKLNYKYFYSRDISLRDIEMLDNNFHKLNYIKITRNTRRFMIYDYLSSLFKHTQSEYSDENISIMDDTLINTPEDINNKLIKYAFTNSLYFIDDASLYSVYESISLADYNLEEFDEYLKYQIKKSKKKKLKGFIKILSNYYEDHYTCNSICKSYKG